MQVIQHDHAARRVGGFERVEQGGRRLAQPALGHQLEQGFARQAPWRVQGFQRLDQMGEQSLEVVLLVRGEPGDGAAGRQPLQLARQGGRLAVARRRHEQDQAPARQYIAEMLFELAALDQSAAEARRLDLGPGKVKGLHDEPAI